MTDTSRRRFLGVAGAGAAAVGTTALLPSVASAAQTRLHGASTSSVVAYVGDPTSDELTLMVDEREVVVHDRDLVHRLLNVVHDHREV
jgi:hypothetical protein